MPAFSFPLTGPSAYLDIDLDDSSPRECSAPPTDVVQMNTSTEARDCMQTRPGDPPFTLNSHPLLRPIDYQALLLLRREEVPTPSEICTLFNLTSSLLATFVEVAKLVHGISELGLVRAIPGHSLLSRTTCLSLRWP